MRTEDDLRAAFYDMERLAPEAVDVLRAVYTQSRRHPLRSGLAVGMAGAVVAVGVLAVASKPAAVASPVAGSALRTRLLAAIDSAGGDILYAHGGPAAGGGTWQSPAYPETGQQVRYRVLGLGSDGIVYKDAEYSFTMPAGNRAAGRYPSNLDQGGLQLSGTILEVNHARHVWGEWHGQFALGFAPNAAVIRAEIANGQFKVVERTELDGQQAVELEITVPPQNEAAPHVTAARLWVNATTYLPMQQYERISNGQQAVTDYTFLPPTQQNLAQLRPEIPASYTHVSGNPAELPGPKPKLAQK